MADLNSAREPMVEAGFVLFEEGIGQSVSPEDDVKGSSCSSSSRPALE